MMQCAAVLSIYIHVETTQRHVRVYSQVHALARLKGVGNILHTPTTYLRRVVRAACRPFCAAQSAG